MVKNASIMKITKIVLFLMLMVVLCPIYSLEINEPAPDFFGTLITGQPINLYEHYISFYEDNNVVVLSFFNTACIPCEEEIKKLSPIQDKYSNKKVKFLLIALEDDVEKVRSHVQDKLNVKNLDIMMDNGGLRAGQPYGVVNRYSKIATVPHLIIIDRNGIVRNIFTGNDLIGDLNKKLSPLLNKYLKEPVKRIPPPANMLNILYTSSLNGNLKPCCPPASLYSGIGRRASVINRELRLNENTLIFETGDFSSVRPNKRLYEAVFSGMSKIPYSAVLPGDQEFILGVDFFIDTLNKYPLPVVFSNISICVDNVCYDFGKKYKIFEVSDYKVAVLSYIDKSAFIFADEEVKKAVTIEELETLQPLINDLRSKSDIVVLLSHSGINVERTIPERVRGIDIIVGGHSQSRLDNPLRIGNTLLLHPGRDGYYVGKLSIYFSEDKKISSSENRLILLTDSIPQCPEMLQIISDYEEGL